MPDIVKRMGKTLGYGIAGFVVASLSVVPVIMALIPLTIVANIAAVVATGALTYGMKSAVSLWS